MQVHIELACNRHAASFEWMLELSMTAFGVHQPPAICLDQSDRISDPHLLLQVRQVATDYSSFWMRVIHAIQSACKVKGKSVQWQRISIDYENEKTA
jgi:hypothetical protein